MGVLLCVLGTQFECHAAPAANADKVYEELRARYLQLRNTDVQIVRAPEWESLLRRLLEFADKHPHSKSAPQALFDAASLYEQLYRRFGGDDRALAAVKVFERVAQEYPGHQLSDDALVKRGDLFLYELKDEAAARKAFDEIVQAYPRGDMLEVAKSRLRSIQSGEYKQIVKVEEKHRTDAAVKEKRGKPLVMIDPGHGGEDFGAVGLGGLLEKDVVLDVAIELEKLLKDNLGAVVRLTRRKDVFVPLAERTNLANDFEADLFVSLHANASPEKTLSGFETYYLDNTADKASRTLAERENASTRYEGPEGDLQYMLSDLIQNAKLDESISLAHILHRSLVEHIQVKWDKSKDLGVKRAPFYVLVGAHMPCVLVELAFIDNGVDGKRLATKAYRQDLAQGVFSGIRSFLERQKIIR